MLWTIDVVLVILWLLGFITGYTLGNFIHILLVIAIIVIVLQVIQGLRFLSLITTREDQACGSAMHFENVRKND